MKKLRIKIHSESHNRAVQERLFKLGYGWKYIGNNFTYPRTDQINAHEDGCLTRGRGLGSKKPTHTLDDLYNMETLESIKSKKGLEAGNWYRSPSSKWVAYYDGKETSKCPYGWDFEGKWDTDLWFQYPENLVKATYEEVLDRFRHEFKDRGFVDGCEFKTMHKHNSTGPKRKYLKTELTLGGCGNTKADIFSNGWSVFYQGTFATPILDELPEIAGYRGEFTETGVKYGCTEVKFDFIMDDAFDYVTTMYTQTGSSVFHDDLKLVKKAVSNHLNHKIDHERHI